uniref:Uncharacterized protein n=2 Tax=Brassica TaxID=3705 RepID=A0A3P6EL85_BRAOL|nr:unnamed protein product [Brassica oleracea]
MVTSQVHLSELKVGRCRETVQMRLIRRFLTFPVSGSLRSVDLSAFDVARSKPKLRFGDAPVTIRFQSCSHYVLSQCFGNIIMNFQTFYEVVEDDNSSAQSTEFLLARQSKFAASQVVWMGGVVNSTRSNRFANGLNITHVAALFYSSAAFAIKNHGDVYICLSVFDGIAYKFHIKFQAFGSKPKVLFWYKSRKMLELTFCSGRLFLNATSSTHLFFDSETSGQKIVDCLVGKVEDEAWSLRIQRSSRSLHHTYRN